MRDSALSVVEAVGDAFSGGKLEASGVVGKQDERLRNLDPEAAGAKEFRPTGIQTEKGRIDP